MKKQEISNLRCSNCVKFHGGASAICRVLDETGIENAVVGPESTACSRIERKQENNERVKKILGGLITIKY